MSCIYWVRLNIFKYSEYTFSFFFLVTDTKHTYQSFKQLTYYVTGTIPKSLGVAIQSSHQSYREVPFTVSKDMGITCSLPHSQDQTSLGAKTDHKKTRKEIRLRCKNFICFLPRGIKINLSTYSWFKLLLSPTRPQHLFSNFRGFQFTLK